MGQSTNHRPASAAGGVTGSRHGPSPGAKRGREGKMAKKVRVGCLFPLPGGAGTRYLVHVGRQVVAVNVYPGGTTEVVPRIGQRVTDDVALLAIDQVRALLRREGERGAREDADPGRPAI